MLYILPRVVLQVKASLYYKTINNKTKKKLILSFPVVTACSWTGMGGRGGTRAAPKTARARCHLPPCVPRAAGGGTEAVAAMCAPRAQDTAALGSALLMPKAPPRPVAPQLPPGGVGEALGGAQRALAATGRAAFWYC